MARDLGCMGTGTPCIRICQLQGNICIGCYRTIEEITNWLKYTDEQRQQIINLLDKRKITLT